MPYASAAVPVGDYTLQVLHRLKLTPHVVSRETDVREVLAKVALGEADAGFVYRTDAKPVAQRTRSVALPNWAQPAIRYEVAVVKASPRRQAAAAFVKKLLSRRGRLLLKQAGFGLAVAILIDATLIRGVLLPAAMTLLGERNWYLPSRLEWLPQIHMPAERGQTLTTRDPLPPSGGVLPQPRLLDDDPA